jgi:hypothetical protein
VLNSSCGYLNIFGVALFMLNLILHVSPLPAQVTQSSTESMAALSLSEGTKAPKAAKKSAKYALARRAGLGTITPSLGLSAAQFGENLDNNFKKHEPEDHKVRGDECTEGREHTRGRRLCSVGHVSLLCLQVILLLGLGTLPDIQRTRNKKAVWS